MTHLQLVLLPVDDHGGDLLVEEDEDGGEEGGHAGGEDEPPGRDVERVNEPAACVHRVLWREQRVNQRWVTTSVC